MPENETPTTLAKGYTDPETVAKYLGITLTEEITAQLDKYIAAVESIIDIETDRNFIADTEASARLYDGDGTCELLIDDCVEVEKVEIGTDSYGDSFTEVPATGSGRYFLDPANAAALKLPFRKVTLSANGLLPGKQNQRVTAKWGYSIECPHDISLAATVFTGGIYNAAVSGGSGEIKSEKIGNYQVTYATESGESGAGSWADFASAKEVINNYKRIYF